MAQQPPLDGDPRLGTPSPDVPPPATADVARAVIPPGAAAAAQGGGMDGGDWASQILDRIDNVIGQVQQRTTRPALVAARGLVFGVIIAVLAVATLVWAWIIWITVITALVKKVWITYLITGGILVIVGALLMRKRRTPEMLP